MLLKFCLLIGYLTLNSNLSVEGFNRYNVSLAQLGTCKEYDIHATGYSYKDFFLVHSLNNSQLRDNEALHLKFYVMTDMDAHILLSVTHHPRLFDRVYEIVIGAGGDTFSAIRSNMGRKRVATNQKDQQLLTVYEPTPIEIIQSKEGKLDVYIIGLNDEPLLSYEDADPLSINYISFSSFGFHNARWFYDCGFDGYDGEMEQEVRPVPLEQRLIAQIETQALNETQPDDLHQINFKFEIHSVYYAQDLSILKTRMNFLLYWNDSRLVWDPEEFNGRNVIVERFLRIWQPKIAILNGAYETFTNFYPSYELITLSNGSVLLSAQNVELTTWCQNSAANWPNEKFFCSINIGFDSETLHDDDSLQLVYDNTRPITDETVATLSEWRFAAIIVDTFRNENQTQRMHENGVLQLRHGDLNIAVAIEHNAGYYRNVYTMPLYASQTFIVLSFLLRGYRRGALILLAFINVSMGLLFITKHAPPNYVPDFLVMHQRLMHIATACYLLHIVIIWLENYPPKQEPGDWLIALVNCSPLRCVLGLRLADSTEYADVLQHPWHELAKIINNCSFLIISVILIVFNLLLLPK